MSNEINFSVTISDDLLAKLLMVFKPQEQPMGIPLQALVGMQGRPQESPNKQKPKAKVGFRINNKESKS